MHGAKPVCARFLDSFSSKAKYMIVRTTHEYYNILMLLVQKKKIYITDLAQL